MALEPTRFGMQPHKFNGAFTAPLPLRSHSFLRDPRTASAIRDGVIDVAVGGSASGGASIPKVRACVFARTCGSVKLGWHRAVPSFHRGGRSFAMRTLRWVLAGCDQRGGAAVSRALAGGAGAAAFGREGRLQWLGVQPSAGTPSRWGIVDGRGSRWMVPLELGDRHRSLADALRPALFEHRAADVHPCRCRPVGRRGSFRR